MSSSATWYLLTKSRAAMVHCQHHWNQNLTWRGYIYCTQLVPIFNMSRWAVYTQAFVWKGRWSTSWTEPVQGQSLEEGRYVGVSKNWCHCPCAPWNVDLKAADQPVRRLYGKKLQQVMVGWTFTRTLTPVLMTLNGSLRLRLKKSDVIRSYYSLTHCRRSTSSTMYCVVCKLNVSMHALRPATIAKICLRTDWCNAFPQFFKYGSESSSERKFQGAKVLGTLAPEERKFHEAKVPWERKYHLWTFRSRERKCRGTKSPDT